MVDLCRVNIWGQEAGILSWNRQRKVGVFEYTPEYVSHGVALTPSMPLVAAKPYAFPALPFETFKGIPALLADSLPDDFGNAVINAWLSRQGRASTDCTPLERLLYIGSRGMGALEFSPAAHSPEKVTDIDLQDLVGIINQIQDKRGGFTANLGEGDAQRSEGLINLFSVGTSAGGARPKALVAMNDKMELKSGQVDAPDGYEHWMLKFDGITNNQYNIKEPSGFGQVEYAYYKMALRAGIEMTECRLLPNGELNHFMTKRFDRVGGSGRVHMQTLCALTGADYKKPGAYSYEELFSHMRVMRLSRKEAIQQFRRMVFNVVARNQDDHTKNVSFLMDREGKWSLSPAYDVTWSYKEDSPWVSQHQMTINGLRDGFQKSDLLAVANQIGNFREAGEVIEEVIEAVASWRDIAKDVGVSEEFASVIEETHRLQLR